MKDSLFLLISSVLGRGCGAGRRPNNDDEGFLISADFKFGHVFSLCLPPPTVAVSIL